MELRSNSNGPKVVKSEINNSNSDRITPKSKIEKPNQAMPCKNVKRSKWKKSKANKLNSKQLMPKTNEVNPKQTHPRSYKKLSNFRESGTNGAGPSWVVP